MTLRPDVPISLPPRLRLPEPLPRQPRLPLARDDSLVDLGEWDEHVTKPVRVDKAYILRSIGKTLASTRYAKGTLARYFVKERTMTKGERKRQRRALWKGKAIDQATC